VGLAVGIAVTVAEGIAVELGLIVAAVVEVLEGEGRF
jgi:hypothetical protein